MKRFKRIYLFVTLCLCIFLLSCGHQGGAAVDRDEERYDSEAAIKYALNYAENRNLNYPEFESNCTNYVSQCLVAGGMKMDKAPEVSEDKIGVYEETIDLWYYQGKQFDSEKPPHFTVSNSFVKTEDFIDYWTQTRGYKIHTYDNTFEGRKKMLEKTTTGSIFVYFDTEGEIVHIGMVTDKDENALYYSSNTRDRKNLNLNEINNFVYPKFGIISLEHTNN